MTLYEVTFRTSPLTDELEDEILNIGANFTVDNHGRTPLTLVTMTDEFAAHDGAAAGLTLADVLTGLGITVYEVHADLVTASDVAERCGVTRQAVNNWIRGDRQSSSPFPAPANLVRGGVWHWSEVNAWLRDQGKAHDDSVVYLMREEETAVNYRLCVKRRAKSLHSPVGHLSVPTVAGAGAVLTHVSWHAPVRNAASPKYYDGPVLVSFHEAQETA